MENYKNLNFSAEQINQKLAWVGDKSKLATGYKLISNKEQPSGNAYRIPWLLAYFPAATSSSNPKENTAQHKPMYIKYDVSDTNIKITALPKALIVRPL